MSDAVDRTWQLHTGWTLRQDEREIELEVDLPFDVHSALVVAEHIGDPYWRSRELELDWVHRNEWRLYREFEVHRQDLHGHWTLSLDSLDCIATVRVNSYIIGRLASQFLRHDLDVTPSLLVGVNVVEIRFHSSASAATEAAARFPFELPCQRTPPPSSRSASD